MAQPASLSGTDGIRSLKDNDAVFRAFDSYPWTKDTTFMVSIQHFLDLSSPVTNMFCQSGLHAILGDPNSPNPQGSPTDMATHARIFYYSQRIGVSIDFTTYQTWLSQNTDHQPPDILPEEYRGKTSESSSASSLAWQQAAPKTELYVDRGADAAASNAGGDQPAYPMAFAEMIKLLQEGKEVPGIKQIPNTIIRDPVSNHLL